MRKENATIASIIILSFMMSWNVLADDQSYKDFLNTKKDVVICTEFSENFEEEMSKGKRNIVFRPIIKRVTWEDWAKSSVYVYRSGPLAHIIHLVSNESIKHFEDHELIYRVRYNVIRENKTTPKIDLLSHYQKLIPQKAADEIDSKPDGWEFVSSTGGMISAAESINDFRTDRMTFTMMVVDKDQKDEEIKKACLKKMQDVRKK